MPLFSAFTPFGQLEFSSDDSDAQKAYTSLVAALSDPRTNQTVVDLTPGGSEEAQVYATAMALGAARATIKRAQNQHNVALVDELLSAQEKRYRITPSAKDTRDQRRAALVAKKLLNRGSREESITNALLAILGPNFVKLRTMDYNAGDVTVLPADPSFGPGIFPRPDAVARLLALVEPVTVTGTPTTVYYQNLDTTQTELRLVAGDVVSVQPETWAQAEQVTITSVAGSGATRALTAVFGRSHDIGATITTGPCPLWTSTQRTYLIVVAAAAAVDPEARRKVDALMARITRPSSTWAIVQPSAPGSTITGAFQLNTSPLGAVPAAPVVIPTTWSPSSRPSLAAWYRGDTAISYNTGFANIWADRSKWGRHASRAILADAKRPSIVAPDINGCTGLNFLSTASVDAGNVQLFPSGAATVCCIFKCNMSLGATEILIAKWSAATSFALVGTGGNLLRFFVNTAAQAAVSNASVADGLPHYVVGIYNPNVSPTTTLYVDGVLQTTTGNTAGAVATTSDHLGIGAKIDASGVDTPGLTADVAEIFCFDEALDVTGLQFVHNYMRARALGT